jgi:hypothetical protein
MPFSSQLGGFESGGTTIGLAGRGAQPPLLQNGFWQNRRGKARLAAPRNETLGFATEDAAVAVAAKEPANVVAAEDGTYKFQSIRIVVIIAARSKR